MRRTICITPPSFCPIQTSKSDSENVNLLSSSSAHCCISSKSCILVSASEVHWDIPLLQDSIRTINFFLICGSNRQNLLRFKYGFHFITISWKQSWCRGWRYSLSFIPCSAHLRCAMYSSLKYSWYISAGLSYQLLYKCRSNCMSQL